MCPLRAKAQCFARLRIVSGNVVAGKARVSGAARRFGRERSPMTIAPTCGVG